MTTDNPAAATKRAQKCESDYAVRGKIKKVARLRDHPATPAGERRASFAAVTRLVKKLYYSKKSFDRYFKESL